MLIRHMICMQVRIGTVSLHTLYNTVIFDLVSVFYKQVSLLLFAMWQWVSIVYWNLIYYNLCGQRQLHIGKVCFMIIWNFH